jgi:type III restriction enzyme
MKFQFDANQQFQLDAVQSVVDLFDGQPNDAGALESTVFRGYGRLISEMGVGNALVLSDGTLLSNLRAVQERNLIAPSSGLDGRHFSIEMETGTGKTYVYLRTIFELNARYGWTKFIIVVPSVAIREGVLNNLKNTGEHFAAIFGNPPVNWWAYDSKQVSLVRGFASTNAIQILVLNIDAFNKPANNVIHVENDKLSGHRPIDFLQATKPIVLIDEPQNVESEQAKKAIETLNPLFTLRYSATHRNFYNLAYRLDPVRAYDLKLVKRIEVDSVLEHPDFNKPFIRVEKISSTSTQVAAKLTIDVQQSNGPARKPITVSQSLRGQWKNANLFEASSRRTAYDRYIIDGIDVGLQTVTFSNGLTLQAGAEHGARADDLMRAQIRETILKHFLKEKELAERAPGQRIKVLSLFFIDRVANYADEPTPETPRAGFLRRIFDEEYINVARQVGVDMTTLLPPEKVRSAYFAQDRKGNAKDTGGDTAADDDTYELIMKDKERLLDPAEPVKFIFSHSALREGWDNPNVFQLCIMREVTADIPRRQQIGRGMRLCVNEEGVRILETNINRLTVIANESYQDFATVLQIEMEKECGVSFEGRIQNARDRRKVALKKGWQLDDNFLQLWERIKHLTRYHVEYATEDLIVACVDGIKGLPPISSPRITAITTEMDMSRQGIGAGRLRSVKSIEVSAEKMALPDMVAYLVRETELTRDTVLKILFRSGRLVDGVLNPQQFLDGSLRAIRHALDRIMIHGIKYEKIAGQSYEMMLFEAHELEGYLSRMIEVEHSIHDAIMYDSEIEKQFALDLDDRPDIKLFVKLPAWFKVETPIGTYNPDWAIVKQPEGEPERLYLVRETKSTPTQQQLRDREYLKIRCGRAHFDELGVDFKTAVRASDV